HHRHAPYTDFSLYRSLDPPHPLSFPTRRSSDLQIRAMDRDDLHALILRHAGEELAEFFIAYATNLIEREPDRAAENGSSLLLIGDRKSTRLNSSHRTISYAVFCLKKKIKKPIIY